MYTSRRVFTTERYLEMMISTKGRYALRVMIDLAQNDGESFVSLKDVAERQGISMKYLEPVAKWKRIRGAMSFTSIPASVNLSRYSTPAAKLNPNS